MSEWISVKDRVPNEYDDVLVYSKEWGCVICATYKPGYGDYKEFADDSQLSHTVDYWMPLPEPPKD
ncbi:MAG: DUF551 domain-containing protein [Dehalococcoidia bacterium]|jgi:hypothetical protein